MSAYDAVNQEARDTWLRERPDSGPGDQTPDPLLDGRDARLRLDPWDVWVCQSCGEVTDSQPEVCRNCNWRNYGYESPAYWCPVCKTPQYVGEPEDRCTDCGHEGGVA